MRTLTNLEYNYLVNELQTLVGKRLRKIYELGEGKFRLNFEGADLLIELGKRMNITKYIEPAPERPSNFAMGMRKDLENAKLIALAQHGFDRVIVFTLEREVKRELILEMFAKGNLLLLDENGKILRAYRKEEWKDRKIGAGEQYKFPQTPGLGMKPSADEIRKLLGEKYVASSLSQIPLGTIYIKEALARAGVEEKKKGSELSEGEISAIAKEIARVVENAKPFGYFKDGKICEFALAELIELGDCERREFESLNEAIDEYYYANPEEEGEKRERKIAKLQKRLEAQKRRLEELKREEEELRAKGDAIYANYKKVEEALKRNKGIFEIEL
jgi:predicted ribosome quality control (RQC) complex YloA/Tae2 family protein